MSGSGTGLAIRNLEENQDALFRNDEILDHSIDELRVSGNQQEKKLGELADKIEEGDRKEAAARINLGDSLKKTLDAQAEELGDLKSKRAIDQTVLTATYVIGQLEKYQELAKNPKTRDQLAGITDKDIQELIDKLTTTALGTVERGEKNYDKRWYQRVAEEKPIWQQILDLKINTTTKYLEQKRLYDMTSKTGSMVELIKLGNYLVGKTGREHGPDLALTIEGIPTADWTAVASDELKDLINEKTSITEVLNILAFLTYSTENKIVVDKKLSVAGAKHNENGEYVSTPMEIVEGKYDNEIESWNKSLASLDGAPMFSTTTMTVHTNFRENITINIPPGILKRKLDNNAKLPIEIKRDDVLPLFTACTRQMIKILNDVRRIFTGWSDLSRTTTGGSSKSKNKSKKTRRRYRRRN